VELLERAVQLKLDSPVRILAGAKAEAGVHGSWIAVELTVKLIERCKTPRGSSVSKCFVMKKLPQAAEVASPDESIAALALITLANGFSARHAEDHAPSEQPRVMKSNDQDNRALVQSSDQRYDSPRPSIMEPLGLYPLPSSDELECLNVDNSDDSLIDMNLFADTSNNEFLLWD
jgi:hypothetical protein